MDIKNNQEALSSFFDSIDKTGQKDNSFADKQATLKSWADYVGEAMAKNSAVQDIEGERLTVEVYNSATLQLLRLKEGEILAKVNSRYPALKLRKLILKQVDRVGEAKDDFSDFKPQLREIVEVKTDDTELDDLLREIDEYGK